jgi:hypothetical protein
MFNLFMKNLQQWFHYSWTRLLSLYMSQNKTSPNAEFWQIGTEKLDRWCKLTIRINQVQIQAVRRQHASQIGLTTFIKWKKYKNDKNSTATEARENINTDLKSLVFHKNVWLNLQNNQILQNKISHQFIVTTSLW